MATLAFRMIGTALGTMLGGPFGGALGGALGAMAGLPVDRALFGGGPRRIEGPRLDPTFGISAQEGAPIPRAWGRVRLGGQVIWATEFEEQSQVEKQGGSGGKGFGGSQARTVRYRYFANVAIGLCEGPISMVRRIWADDRELDLTRLTLRIYLGDEDQPVDPLIAAKQASAVPAFRGLAYVVFEAFPLDDYGNRLPQFRFEVIRAANPVAAQIRSINLIPGSTEFGYQPRAVSEDLGLGETRPLNRHQLFRASNWEAALDTLQALTPALQRVTLITAWFGDDLRPGHLRLQPRVERSALTVIGTPWQAAGLVRDTAIPVSVIDGRPAYGGSPDDAAVVAALRDLKARGLAPVLHPFVLMDIPPDNILPALDGRGGTQPPFPWRGRIMPEAGASPAAIAEAIAQCLGHARPEHFSLAGDTVVYTGPEDWGYRRMVLHHAMLALAAGGVETFLLGSELVGLTHALGPDGRFPFVEGLMALAADVRGLLGAQTRITYAADWTEYGARVREGGADIRFPLDPLWAHPAIDLVAIDAYPPLADWRPGRDHADAAMASGAADLAYLTARILGGEAHDWYYADDAGRAAGARLPITDGAYGKPWLYRAKDLPNWWQNRHYPRANGIESPVPTPWLPASKPIALTEVGCPAVHLGSNQPNLFPDPKSVESGLPHFSRGGRDDLVALRLVEAWLTRFGPGASADHPTGPEGQPMILPDFIAPWAWDARPYPAFPRLETIWADGANWACGHWLTGRLEAVPLMALIEALFAAFDLPPPEGEGVDGLVDGFVLDRPLSLRAALEPLARLFGLTFLVREGRILVRGRPGQVHRRLDSADLVPASADGRWFERIRQPDQELPRRLTLGFVDSDSDFEPAAVTAERPLGLSAREEAEATTLHLPRAEAQRLAEQALHDRWCGRETIRFRLPLRDIALEPGDVVAFEAAELPGRWQITRLTDARWREVEARAFDPALIEATPPAGKTGGAMVLAPPIAGRPLVRWLDLPIERGQGLGMLALRAEPWHGPYAVVDLAGGGARTVAEIGRSARLGETLTALEPGPLWRWDNRNHLDIRLAGGALASPGPIRALAEGPAIALTAPDGESEILLFREAVLVGEGRYRLSGLLRGLGSSERAAQRHLAAGAAVTVLDEALVSLGLAAGQIGQTGRWRILAAGQDLGDPAAVDLVATPTGSSLRPLAPVHPRARREAGGIRITFCRRTRSGGDSWDLYEVPLGEAQPGFRLDLLAGSGIVRSVMLTTTEWLYPAAWEQADFGAPLRSLTLAISQISAEFGPGDPCRQTIAVHAGPG